MRCPKCSHRETKVIDSRTSRDAASIRRRRECLECGCRFSTTEEILRDGLVVRKRDGRREDFDRSKMLGGIHRACEKRPVDLEQLDMLVTDVINTLQNQFDAEIPSRAIGDRIMERLRRIDQVAYVRFASVYKDFRDVEEFMREISTLGAKKT